MRDHELSRNQWPIGTINEVFPSKDGKIRKVSVRVKRGQNFVTYTRPINELVYLLSPWIGTFVVELTLD